MVFNLENCEFSTLKKKILKNNFKTRKHTKFTALVMFLFVQANNN